MIGVSLQRGDAAPTRHRDARLALPVPPGGDLRGLLRRLPRVVGPGADLPRGAEAILIEIRARLRVRAEPQGFPLPVAVPLLRIPLDLPEAVERVDGLLDLDGAGGGRDLAVDGELLEPPTALAVGFEIEARRRDPLHARVVTVVRHRGAL